MANLTQARLSAMATTLALTLEARAECLSIIKELNWFIPRQYFRSLAPDPLTPSVVAAILYVEYLVDQPAKFRTSKRQTDFITNLDQAVEILYHLVPISLGDIYTPNDEDPTLLIALLRRTLQYFEDPIQNRPQFHDQET